MLNEENLRKLQALYAYERLKNQCLGVPSPQSVCFNLNTAPNLYPQNLTQSSLWAQPYPSLGVSNALQAQMLLRTQLTAGGFLNLPGAMQDPILNMTLLNRVQAFPPTINTVQPQLDIKSRLEKVQQLSQLPEKATPVLEKRTTLLPEIPKDRVQTNTQLPKGDSIKVSKAEETNPDQELEETQSKESDSQEVAKVSTGKKIKKKEIICGHPDRKHYAKGYCSECYHKKSRMQKPKNCPHDNLYARELCQKCYAEKYKKKGKRN